MPIHDLIMAAANQRVTSISFVASNTSTTGSVTVPSSARSGDFALFIDRDGNATGTPPSQVSPSGWDFIDTIAATVTGGSARSSIFHKILTSSDPGATVTGMNNGFARKIILVFRPDCGITSVTIGSYAEYLANGTNSQTITSGSGAAPLVVIAHMACNVGQTLNTRSFTPTQDATVSSAASQEARYKIYNSSPANVTAALSASRGGNTLQSFYFSLT